MKTAVIFMHEPTEGVGLFGGILQERGFMLRPVLTAMETIDMEPLTPDLLVVMGGPMGVYEADRHPYLTREIAIIKERMAADRPTLGICLGAQLMAAALGANVYKGTQGPEYGWREIRVNAAGKARAVRHLEGMMFHYHGDTFDMPPDATLLASSEKYKNQVFSHGKNALAFQCHPEVTAEILVDWAPPGDWLEGLARERDGKKWSMEDFMLETAAHIATLNRKAGLFLNEWLESVDL
jgi:GMP synthase (glutamine-hydrolysing)